MDGSARRLGKPLIQKTQTEMGSREGVLTVLRYKSPREADEMGSVFAYLLSKVERAAEEVADGIRQLCRNTPSGDFWDLPKDERPAFGDVERIEDLEHTDSHIQGIAGFGPEFLCRMLHMDPISRRDTFIGNTRGFWCGAFIGFRLGVSIDSEYPVTDPVDRLEGPNFEHIWSTLPPLGGSGRGAATWTRECSPGFLNGSGRDPDADWE